MKVLSTFLISAVFVLAIAGFFIGGVFTDNPNKNVGDAMQHQQKNFQKNYNDKHQVQEKTLDY